MLAALLLPELAEARRGGGYSGSWLGLWWIPALLAFGVGAFLHSVFPEFFSFIGALIGLVFVSGFGALFLAGLGLISSTRVLIAWPTIFVLIAIGPAIFFYIKDRVQKI